MNKFGSQLAATLVLTAILSACGTSAPTSLTSSVYIGGNSAATDHRDPAAALKVYISSAVFDRFNGTAIDTWGTGYASFDMAFARGEGSGHLDTLARYVYLYQVVNAAESNIDLAWFSQNLVAQPEYITSWGAFPGLTLVDVNGQVDATNSIGPETWLHVPMEDLPARVPYLQTSGDVWVEVGNQRDPVSEPITVRSAPGHFDLLWSATNGLPPGRRSTVVGFTTDLPPTLDEDGVGPVRRP